MVNSLQASLWGQSYLTCYILFSKLDAGIIRIYDREEDDVWQREEDDDVWHPRATINDNGIRG